MEKDGLKLNLLEAIIKCDDAAILKKVEKILLEKSKAEEPEDKYIKESDPVPESHYRQLDEEFEKFKRGEVKGVSWDDLRKEIKSKYGF